MISCCDWFDENQDEPLLKALLDLTYKQALLFRSVPAVTSRTFNALKPSTA
jgi:hypothetical protein